MFTEELMGLILKSIDGFEFPAGQSNGLIHVW